MLRIIVKVKMDRPEKQKSLVNRLLKLAEQFNCFLLEGLKKGDHLPLIVEGQQIGLVSPAVRIALADYPNVFHSNSRAILLNPEYKDYKERSDKIAEILNQLRKTGQFSTLNGWRDECFEIRRAFSDKPLLKMERSATCLFGICKYGVSINGYVKSSVQGRSEIKVWIQKRSENKPTWPGKWDNMVAGGVSVGYGVLGTALKEAEEEASVPKNLLQNLISAGSVSYYYKSEKGLFPNTEFVYDLELPPDFIPTVNDGEVSKFELVTSDQLVEKLLSPDFKTTSCPITIDFLIRHGIVLPDDDPNFLQLIELLHVPLQSIYKSTVPI